MKRLALALLLTGCCSMHVNRGALEELRSQYDVATANENAVCLVLADCDAVRTAHYNAAALLTEAADDGCRLKDARAAVDAYVAAEQMP